MQLMKTTVVTDCEGPQRAFVSTMQVGVQGPMLGLSVPPFGGMHA